MVAHLTQQALLEVWLQPPGVSVSQSGELVRWIEGGTDVLGAQVDVEAAMVCRYASRFNEPSALGHDGLQLDWEHETVWISPPWALLPDVVDKLTRSSRGILIFPDWQQEWRVRLNRLPGFDIKLPPPRISVVPFHSNKVEPFLNSGVTRVARILGSRWGSIGS